MGGGSIGSYSIISMQKGFEFKSTCQKAGFTSKYIILHKFMFILKSYGGPSGDYEGNYPYYLR